MISISCTSLKHNSFCSNANMPQHHSKATVISEAWVWIHSRFTLYLLPYLFLLKATLHSLLSKSWCCLTNTEKLALVLPGFSFHCLFLPNKSWVYAIFNCNSGSAKWSSFYSLRLFMDSFLQPVIMMKFQFLCYRWHVTQFTAKLDNHVFQLVASTFQDVNLLL